MIMFYRENKYREISFWRVLWPMYHRALVNKNKLLERSKQFWTWDLGWFPDLDDTSHRGLNLLFVEKFYYWVKYMSISILNYDVLIQEYFFSLDVSSINLAFIKINV